MRSSRSTKRHASWRARSVPTVVLPEPMKPARQTMKGRGVPPRGTGFCVTIGARTKLIALQDTNCTTEGRELYFCQAGANGTKKSVCVLGCSAANAVRVGLKDLGVSANRREFQFTRAQRADQRTARAVNDDVAGNFLQVNVTGDAF